LRENTTALTTLVCPVKVKSSDPVATTHTFTVWSSEALATNLESGEKATPWTGPSWWRMCLITPYLASQIINVLSSDPLTKKFPSPE